MAIKPLGIPPQEAVNLIKAKGFNQMESGDWRTVWAKTHAAAFTVARSEGYKVLGDIHAAILEAQEGKLPFKQFVEQLQPKLQAQGWWGRKDGVQLGSPRRLEIIYRTNLRQAEAAGKWTRIQALKHKMPYLRYVCVMDKKTREEHIAWHGLILPVDHPFWDEHFPPNGWNCRCRVVPLSQDQIDDHKEWKVSDGANIPFDEREPWLNEVTGQEMMIPRGVDPAFAHNAGKVAIDVHASRALGHTLEKLPPEVAAKAAEASAEFITRALSHNFLAMVNDLDLAKPQGRKAVVGILDQVVLNFLAKEAEKRGETLELASGAIFVDDDGLSHMIRDLHLRRGTSPNRNEIMFLVSGLARPRAILYDEKDGKLLYIYEPEGNPQDKDGRPMLLKVAVDIGFNQQGRLARRQTRPLEPPRISTAELTPVISLKKKNLKPIMGEI